MNCLADREENRMGVIIYLLEALKGKSIGKKSIQKLIYLLQEAFGVELNYRYKMHSYGPYCTGLAMDLDLLVMMGIVCTKVTTITNSYEVNPERDNEPTSGVQQFLNSHQVGLDRLLNIFEQCSAKKLELYATMHMTERILRGRGQDSGKASVVREIKIMKPRYSNKDLKVAFKFLLNNSVIKR